MLVVSADETHELKSLAKEGIQSRAIIPDLKRKLAAAKRDVEIYKSRYEKLYEQTKDFLSALTRSPELVKEFICSVISKPLMREKIAGYDSKYRDDR